MGPQQCLAFDGAQLSPVRLPSTKTCTGASILCRTAAHGALTLKTRKAVPQACGLRWECCPWTGDRTSYGTRSRAHRPCTHTHTNARVCPHTLSGAGAHTHHEQPRIPPTLRASSQAIIAPSASAPGPADWHFSHEHAAARSGTPTGDRKVVLDSCHVHPMTITVTLGKAEGGVDPFKDMLPAWVRALLLSRAHHLRLHWDAFYLHSVTDAVWVVAQRLQRHYLRQTLSQAYKLLPSVLPLQTRPVQRRARRSGSFAQLRAAAPSLGRRASRAGSQGKGGA